MSITCDGSTFTFNNGSTQTSRHPVQITQVQASGSAVAITGIPSTARTIWIGLNSIATSGTDQLMLHLGSGGFSNLLNCYGSTANFSASGTAGVAQAAGGANYLAITPASAATYAWTGIITIQRLADTGVLGNNGYYVDWYLGSANAVRTCVGAGDTGVQANSVLDRVRLIVSGVNTLSGYMSVTYA